MCLGLAHHDEISFEIDRELHSQIIPKLQHALFLLFWCFLNLPLCGLRDDGLRVFP